MVNAYDFGKTLMHPLDEYIKMNVDRLTCDDVAQIYFGLRDCGLPDLVGTATNFTGVSEFLVFRSIFHLLGGHFAARQEKGRPLSFVDEARQLKIGHDIGSASIGLVTTIQAEPKETKERFLDLFWDYDPDTYLEVYKLTDKLDAVVRGVTQKSPAQALKAYGNVATQTALRYRPDIFVEHDGQLVAAAEIKINLQKGGATLEESVRDLRALRENHRRQSPDPKLAIIMFYRQLSEDQLRRFKQPWLNVLVLEDRSERFGVALTRVLGLDKFVTAEQEQSL